MLKHVTKAAPRDWRAAHAFLEHIDRHLLSSERALAYQAQRELDQERTILVREHITYSQERRTQLKLVCEQLRLKIEEMSGKNPEGALEATKNLLMLLERADPTHTDEQRAARLEVLQA